MEFIPLIVIMIAMYFLLIMPQQRKAKQTREMLAQLEVGDEVVTVSGIYGLITEFDGPTVFLAVNDATEIKITRSSIAEQVVYADDTEDAK